MFAAVMGLQATLARGTSNRRRHEAALLGQGGLDGGCSTYGQQVLDAKQNQHSGIEVVLKNTG